MVLVSILCAAACNFYAKNAVDIANRAQWRNSETGYCLEKIHQKKNAANLHLPRDNLLCSPPRRPGREKETMNLKRSANATVREIFSHGPGEVRVPSLRQRPLSTLQRLCDAFDTERTDDSCASILSLQYSVYGSILTVLVRTVNFRAVKRRRPGCWFFVRFNKNSTGSSPRRSR